MGRIFGTDGVRGIANLELTTELAFKLGQAGAYVLTAETRHTPRILVGLDTRISGDMLEAAMIAGICSVGAKAVSLGVIPTPAVACLARLYEADAGVVISASHNTFEFNGIKFFDSKGYKLPDAIEERIEAIILGSDVTLPKPTGRDIGARIINRTAVDDYAEFLLKTVNVDLKGLKVAVDCANGASYRVAPQVLSYLGAEVFITGGSPDGININDGCGSTHMEAIAGYTISVGADIGLAFDGDADRVLAVDHRGRTVDGDQIMAVIGLNLKREGQLTQDTIVTTVMSNLGFDLLAKREGIKLIKTKVGDRYVLEEMLQKGYILGGENSGHLILLNHNTTGDGLVTALQLLQIMKKTGKTLEELSSVMEILPQVLRNARVSNHRKYSYLEDEVIARECSRLEQEFHGEGRVLIRPSGTEPLVRVMIEGKDQELIAVKAQELVELIEARLR